MAKQTIIIRDNNGAARSGLSVKLYGYEDGSFVPKYAGNEVQDKAGVYEFEDVIYERYKLYINDVEEPSWDGGSEDGRFFGGRVSEIVTDLDLTSHKIINLTDGTYDSDAATYGQVKGKIDKTGGAFTGDVSMSGKRLRGAPTQGESTDPSDFASVGLILGVNSFIAQNYVNIPSSVIFVDSENPSILGRKYSKIQDAINYAQTKNPTATNQYNIIIFPGKVNTGYSEDITLQAFVNLVGIGRPTVTGTITGGNSNTKIRNIKFTYHGNLSLNSVNAESCIFRVTNDDTGNILTISSCTLINCSLINVGEAEFSPAIVSAGGNILVNCISNIPCTLQTGDKGSIASIESVTTDFS